MKTISIQQFCFHYDIPKSFIVTLSDIQLIELIEDESDLHIRIEDVARIEKLMRIHYELNVNFEGLDIINNLLNQINSLHQRIDELQNKVAFYVSTPQSTVSKTTPPPTIPPTVRKST